MGKKFLAAFPATNNIDMNITNMYRGIVEQILMKFLPFKFNTVVIDTKQTIPVVYNTDESGYKLGSKYEESTPKKPIIRFKFTQKGNNLEDTQLGVHLLKRMQNAHGFDARMDGYVPFFKDIFDVSFYYSPIKVRTDLSIDIIVGSKSDQTSFINIIDTNIDQRCGMEFNDVPMGIFLPHDFINSYKEAVFKKDLIKIRDLETPISNDQREQWGKLVDDKTYELLRQFSNGYIDADYIGEAKKRTYDLLVHRLIYVKMERFQPDEGEKKNSVYTKFTINSSGFLEYFSILNFLIDFPSVVNGNFIEKKLFEIYDQNKNITYTKYFAERYTETRDRDPFFEKEMNRKRFRMFWDEQDIVFDSEGDEKINYFESFLPKTVLAFKFLLVAESCTDKELKENIYFSIHKKDELLVKDEDYEIENGVTIIMKDVETVYPYHIRMYVDYAFFGNRWELYKDKFLKAATEKEISVDIELEKVFSDNKNPFLLSEEELPTTNGIVDVTSRNLGLWTEPTDLKNIKIRNKENIKTINY